MDEQKFNQIYLTKLTPKQHEFLCALLDGKSDEQIMEKLGVNNRSSISKHISAICKQFGIKNDKGEYEKLRPELIDLFIQYKPELVHGSLIEKYGYQVTATLESPEGPVRAKSPFYIERRQIDSECYQNILQPGSLIRIKGAKKAGKTSLLNRLIVQAKQQNYHIVRLNFLDVETALYSDLKAFLNWFCGQICNQLKLQPTAMDFSKNILVDCKTFFQQEILETLNNPIVLAMEEVDCIFPYPIAVEFFTLIRSWFEETKKLEIWENLRMVLLHSTNVYVNMNVNQSPFNVGLPVELSEFTCEMVETLAKRHNLPLQAGEIESLIEIIGGHPYLVRLAFYRLALRQVNLETLLQELKENGGIYQPYLQSQSATLDNYPQLKEALKQVINTNLPVPLEEKLKFQLLSTALVKLDGNKIIPSCKLYRDYFDREFSSLN
jgi:DNA-binding CsgD family transcriptional regulator